MSYGRLDIYWPDGPVESHTLEKPIIAVGRSSGNDLVLDTSSVSRYHISLTYRDHQMILEDLESVNGTYVDGEHIRPHEPRLLHGGEEVMVGDIRVIYHPEISEIPTRPNRFSDETQKIEVQQPNFSVALLPPNMPVTPGTSIQVVLSIKNLTAETERYAIEVTGVPKAWVRLERAEVELSAGQESDVGLTFKPLRRSDSTPGDYPVTIRIRPKSTPDHGIEAPLKLRMLSFSGFGIALGTPRMLNRGTFELHVHNQGSAPLPLLIRGRTPENDLVFDIRPPGLTLNPGERQTWRGRISTRSSTVIGGAHEKPFDLIVQSQDASHFLTAVSGSLDVKPIIPVWAQGISLLGLVGAALLAILIIGVLIVALGRSVQAVEVAVPPTLSATSIPILKVNTFTISPNPVLRNVRQTITVTWDVTGATAIKFQGLSALTGQSDDNSYVASNSLRLPNVMPRDGGALTLIATSDGGTSVTQTITVEITNPTCQTTQAQMAYGGPSQTYSPVGMIPANSTIEVDGQNPGGTWVHRVPAPEPQVWVAVAGLTCNGFVPTDLTLISDIPAFPTATPAAATPIPEIPTLVTSTSVPPTATIIPTLTPIIVPSTTPTDISLLVGVS